MAHGRKSVVLANGSEGVFEGEIGLGALKFLARFAKASDEGLIYGVVCGVVQLELEGLQLLEGSLLGSNNAGFVDSRFVFVPQKHLSPSLGLTAEKVFPFDQGADLLKQKVGCQGLFIFTENLIQGLDYLDYLLVCLVQVQVCIVELQTGEFQVLGGAADSLLVHLVQVALHLVMNLPFSFFRQVVRL